MGAVTNLAERKEYLAKAKLIWTSDRLVVKRPTWRSASDAAPGRQRPNVIVLQNIPTKAGFKVVADGDLRREYGGRCQGVRSQRGWDSDGVVGRATWDALRVTRIADDRRVNSRRSSCYRYGCEAAEQWFRANVCDVRSGPMEPMTNGPWVSQGTWPATWGQCAAHHNGRCRQARAARCCFTTDEGSFECDFRMTDQNGSFEISAPGEPELLR